MPNRFADRVKELQEKARGCNDELVQRNRQSIAKRRETESKKVSRMTQLNERIRNEIEPVLSELKIACQSSGVEVQTSVIYGEVIDIMISPPILHFAQLKPKGALGTIRPQVRIAWNNNLDGALVCILRRPKILQVDEDKFASWDEEFLVPAEEVTAALVEKIANEFLPSIIK
jgi:hypothetical protein